MADKKPKVEESQIGPGAWDIPIPEGAELGGMVPGTRIIKCTEEPKESLSSKQEPQTEFTFVVDDPAAGDLNGREAHYWCSRKPKAWWNLVQTLDALEVPYEIIKDDAGNPKTFRFDPMACVGKYAKGVWEEQTYEGRTRSRLQRVIGVSEDVESLEGGSDELPF